MNDRLFTMPQTETTSDDHYTPPWVFETLGLRFDLDVAAPPGGIPWIPANRHYTQAEDGLSAEWTGRVWMNPPYSKVAPWIRRFVDHRNGVGMVPVVKANWMRDLWAEVDGLTYLHKPDIKFHRPDGKTKNILFPVVLIAMGADNVEACRRIGPTR